MSKPKTYRWGIYLQVYDNNAKVWTKRDLLQTLDTTQAHINEVADKLQTAFDACETDALSFNIETQKLS